MDGSRVRPSHLEWPSLALWPPVGIYAAFVFLSIPSGEAVSFRTAVPVGLVLAGLLIAQSVYRLLAHGYWWQDRQGFTRGRIATLRVPFTDVESYVIGMPARLPLLLRILGKVPTDEVQRSLDSANAHRRTAIVLRLRGKRLLPVALTTRNMVGGLEFRALLLERLAGHEQPATSYSDAEIGALARVAFTRLIEVG